MSKGKQLYDRALERIPWGTQTNAKRLDETLRDSMPAFIVRARGCEIEDVDGNLFTDFRSSLGAIVLGYNHPAVVESVRQQLEDGVLFSMASPLEVEVAEMLVGYIPGVEQVRFMKTGSGANSAALRIARSFTGRDHIVACGYLGHADWLVAGSGAAPVFPREENGVPRMLDDMVSRVDFGDSAALESVFAENGSKIAALMMVGHDWSSTPGHEFVETARRLASQYDSVLIFDQVLTGFRLHTQGAAAYYDVVPDLNTFAKGISNGFPLSVVAGRKEIMSRFDQTNITITHGGETLSLAAAKACIEIFKSQPVVDHLWNAGRRLTGIIQDAASKHAVDAEVFGLPPAPQVRFDSDPERDAGLRRTFHHGLLQNGVFPAQPFLMTLAHDDAVLDRVTPAFDAAMHAVANQ